MKTQPIKDIIYEKVKPHKIEAPTVYTHHNVMYWEPKSQELLKLKQDGSVQSATLLSKAKDFLLHDCIEKMSDFLYRCKPIKNYNKTTYMISTVNYQYKCNCQGFKQNAYCSHCLAVKQFIFIGDKKLR